MITLSGLVVMFDGYDDIALFLACFDIPVSLGNLFQRIASINDRFYPSGLDQLLEENQILTHIVC